MNGLNEWIDLKEYNVVFPIKYGRENVAEFYSDLVPIYSDKFIYDYENNKVKGAEGYCILSHEEHERLLNEQSKGLELRYDKLGNIITYNKKPMPQDVKFYEPEYNYITEVWEEKANAEQIARIDYEEYSKFDTPRFNRILTTQDLITDYDNYLLELETFLSRETKNMERLPVPSVRLKEFAKKYSEVL